jgi:hypothetical protein
MGIAVAAYVLVGRPRLVTWGARSSEIEWETPANDQVPAGPWDTTRAITIEAAPGSIWPWLVQMGQGRGGFYSYDWLEQSLGFDTKSADRILPEYQYLKVGDSVKFHPRFPAVPVTVMEPNRCLALGANWMFLLTGLDERRTRLVVKSRWGYGPGWVNRLLHHVVYEPAQFVMEHKMLEGIKERAEATEREQRHSPAGG